MGRLKRYVPVTYKDTGVDVDESERFVARIKERLPNVTSFSGLFPLKIQQYREPVLVSSTDGVGTKLLLCDMMGRYDTIGIDLVAMVVNDILVYGAEPLFFLDYYATGKLKAERADEILTGILEGCRRAKCSLIGGETAELPGLYHEGQFDLAGFGVGIVERRNLIDGKHIKADDTVIALASNGLHANGYTLARHVLLDKAGFKLDQYIDELEETLGECLLRPTTIYTKIILELVRNFEIRGIAHITGGGIRTKLARILPHRVDAEIYIDSWDIPPIFQLIRKLGPVETEEMYNVFNMGIGMVLVVDTFRHERILEYCEKKGYKAFVIGSIFRGAGNVILKG